MMEQWTQFAPKSRVNARKEEEVVDQDRSHRRSYQKMPEAQSAALKAAYQECAHPSLEQREALGLKVGLEVRKVTWWFSNYRAKLVKEGGAREDTGEPREVKTEALEQKVFYKIEEPMKSEMKSVMADEPEAVLQSEAVMEPEAPVEPQEYVKSELYIEPEASTEPEASIECESFALPKESYEHEVSITEAIEKTSETNMDDNDDLSTNGEDDNFEVPKETLMDKDLVEMDDQVDMDEEGEMDSEDNMVNEQETEKDNEIDNREDIDIKEELYNEREIDNDKEMDNDEAIDNDTNMDEEKETDDDEEMDDVDVDDLDDFIKKEPELKIEVQSSDKQAALAGWCRIGSQGVVSPDGLRFRAKRHAIQQLVREGAAEDTVQGLRDIYVSEGWTRIGLPQVWLGMLANLVAYSRFPYSYQSNKKKSGKALYLFSRLVCCSVSCNAGLTAMFLWPLKILKCHQN